MLGQADETPRDIIIWLNDIRWKYYTHLLYSYITRLARGLLIFAQAKVDNDVS